VQTILLQSGDAFVFGGPSRLRYHGVARILPGTSPGPLGLEGRLNLTFRQY
jgi:alkylated DNA repair protein (DNA oxidative demethylase)